MMFVLVAVEFMLLVHRKYSYRGIKQLGAVVDFRNHIVTDIFNRKIWDFFIYKKNSSVCCYQKRKTAKIPALYTANYFLVIHEYMLQLSYFRFEPPRNRAAQFR